MIFSLAIFLFGFSLTSSVPDYLNSSCYQERVPNIPDSDAKDNVIKTIDAINSDPNFGSSIYELLFKYDPLRNAISSMEGIKGDMYTPAVDGERSTLKLVTKKLPDESKIVQEVCASLELKAAELCAKTMKARVENLTVEFFGMNKSLIEDWAKSFQEGQRPNFDGAQIKTNGVIVSNMTYGDRFYLPMSDPNLGKVACVDGKVVGRYLNISVGDKQNEFVALFSRQEPGFLLSPYPFVFGGVEPDDFHREIGISNVQPC